MTGKTHAICGTITAVTIAVCTKGSIQMGTYTVLPAISVLAAPTGSYMPDIDLHRSKMGSKHKIISKLLTHRGFTHTLVVPMLLVLLQYWLMSLPIPVLPDLVFGYNVGWLIHIIADMFNKKGVPVLWPLTKTHFHVASVLTSSKQEYFFIFFWVVVHIAICWLVITHR